MSPPLAPGQLGQAPALPCDPELDYVGIENGWKFAACYNHCSHRGSLSQSMCPDWLVAQQHEEISFFLKGGSVKIFSEVVVLLTAGDCQSALFGEPEAVLTGDLKFKATKERNCYKNLFFLFVSEVSFRRRTRCEISVQYQIFQR